MDLNKTYKFIWKWSLITNAIIFLISLYIIFATFYYLYHKTENIFPSNVAMFLIILTYIHLFILICTIVYFLLKKKIKWGIFLFLYWCILIIYLYIFQFGIFGITLISGL
jgi:hypothetical protein